MLLGVHAVELAPAGGQERPDPRLLAVLPAMGIGRTLDVAGQPAGSDHAARRVARFDAGTSRQRQSQEDEGCTHLNLTKLQNF